MKVMSAGKAKNAFGLLMDLARAEPVTIAKHGRPVVVVLSIEEYERLKGPTDGVAHAAEPVAASLNAVTKQRCRHDAMRDQSPLAKGDDGR